MAESVHFTTRVDMSDYLKKEERCQQTFRGIGSCFHLWTPENFEIIFRNPSDFRTGMGIIAIAAKCNPDVSVLTFELMTNHLHILAIGEENKLLSMFNLIRKYLIRMTKDSGRTINWALFQPGIRQLDSLADVRNVLIYDNRNGFLVNDNHTPFSYPWGSNSCYFNPDARKRYTECSLYSSIKERRLISHSHISDGLQGLKILDNCFSPFSFCNIDAGESLFRDASHYFYMLGKNIEHNIMIAKEIGESISYTDDELYAAVSLKCKEEYGTANISEIPSEKKIGLAKIMRYDYNATQKQIQRILRLEAGIMCSIFGSRG